MSIIIGPHNGETDALLQSAGVLARIESTRGDIANQGKGLRIEVPNSLLERPGTENPVHREFEPLVDGPANTTQPVVSKHEADFSLGRQKEGPSAHITQSKIPLNVHGETNATRRSRKAENVP